MIWLESVIQFIKRLFVLFVRIIEKTLTGQTDYRIYTSEIADFDAVTDLLQAKLLKKEVEVFMRRTFGISIDKPIVIELYTGDDFNLNGIIMELNGSLGRYHYTKLKSKMVHMVYVKNGLEKKRFKSVLAHEMTHAFLREADILPTNRFVREGFARWVEYKVLLNLGLDREAEKIKMIKTWKYGKAINRIFALEEKVGEINVASKLKAGR